MAAISTPPRGQRNTSAIKRMHASSPLLETPNSKSKVKKNKTKETEEENISLQDVYNLIKEMRVDMDKKYSAIESKVEALEKQMSTVEEKLTKKIIQETEKAKKSIEEDVNASFQFLEAELATKIASLDKIKNDHNNLEQYTRKNSVRLFGVKEIEDEETTPERNAVKIFEDNLRVSLEDNEIEIAHRAGKYSPEGKFDAKKARPILIKFQSHKSKEKIMKSKREFKGSNYWIAEDLTAINAGKVKTLNELRKAMKIKNVWTTDGKIRVRKLDDSVIMIFTDEDISQLARE